MNHWTLTGKREHFAPPREKGSRDTARVRRAAACKHDRALWTEAPDRRFFVGTAPDLSPDVSPEVKKTLHAINRIIRKPDHSPFCF